MTEDSHATATYRAQLEVFEKKNPAFFKEGTTEGQKIEYIRNINAKRGIDTITDDTDPSFSRLEIDRKLVAYMNRGFSLPKNISELKDSEATKLMKQFQDIESTIRPETENTQILMAEGFIKANEGNWIYNIDCKKWFFWNGKYWEIDSKESIRNVVKDHLKEYLVKLPIMQMQNTGIMNITKFIVGLNTAKGIRDILSIAAPGMTVLDRDFDNDNHIINCQNGILNIDTLTLMIHNRNEYCSRIAGVEYNPEATCPMWEKHIETVFDGDKDLIENVQELLGYSLFLGNPDAVFTVCFGSGRNGKSVTIELMHHVLGTYAVSVSPNCFMDDGGNPGGDRIKMSGARLISATEPADTKNGRCSLDSGFIKAATGNDVLSARRLYCEGINFKVEGLVVLATNTLPKIRDPSIAIWERIWCVPFNHYFGEDRNTRMSESLKKEGSGILNWLIAGYKMYAEKGRLKQCNSISAQTSEYRHDEDFYSAFFDDCTVRDPDSKITSGELYTLYCAWFERKYPGKKAASSNKFGREMSSRFQQERTSDKRFYVGICAIGQRKVVTE